MSKYIKPKSFRRNPFISVPEDLFFDNDNFTDSYYRLTENENESTQGQLALRTEGESHEESERQKHFQASSDDEKKRKSTRSCYKTSIVVLSVALALALCAFGACLAIIVDLNRRNKQLLYSCANATSHPAETMSNVQQFLKNSHHQVADPH